MKFTRGVMKPGTSTTAPDSATHPPSRTCRVVRSGAMTNSIPDIAESKCVFAIGSNTFEQHPLIGRKIVQAS